MNEQQQYKISYTLNFKDDEMKVNVNIEINYSGFVKTLEGIISLREFNNMTGMEILERFLNYQVNKND